MVPVQWVLPESLQLVYSAFRPLFFHVGPNRCIFFIYDLNSVKLNIRVNHAQPFTLISQIARIAQFSATKVESRSGELSR